MPRAGLAPGHNPQTLSRRDAVDPRQELSTNGVEDTNSPGISSSNNEPTQTHWKSHVSSLQDQIQDIQIYRDIPSSERTAQLSEGWSRWTENGNSSFTAAEYGSLRDAAIAQSGDHNSKTSNSYQGSSRRSRSRKTFRVPYIFEFVPFPGHTCAGRGTIPLGTLKVYVDRNTENSHYFKYDASFQGLLDDYNSRNHLVFANEPVELRHVTEVSLRYRVEFRASVRLARNLREKKVLVVTLLKSYPDCPECRCRGRLHDDPPS